MSVKQSHYEELLALYSSQKSALALLREYRPYLELVPSMRRPSKSIISIPLPIVRTRQFSSVSGQGSQSNSRGQLVQLPCDVALLMCDPDWKIKTGVEIFIFIYRPQEDFSELLGRWRQTQLIADGEYEWLMPPRYRYVLGEAAEMVYPLFVIFPGTPERIKKGLKGAGLPFVVNQLAEDTLEARSFDTSSTSENLFEDLVLDHLDSIDSESDLFPDGNTASH